MHILIIPSWYKTIENPVWGSFFEEQARALMDRSHKVGILNPFFIPFSNRKRLIFRQWNDAGLNSLQFEVRGRIPGFRKINYNFFAQNCYEEFKNYCRKYGKPDVIHAHSVFMGGIAGCKISRKENIPFVLTEHLTNFITGGIKIQSDMDVARDVLRCAKVRLVVSNDFANRLSNALEMKPDEFLVLGNMVNPIFFDGCKPNRISGKPFRFFANSFFSPRKGIENLMKAFDKFSANFPDSEFHIGGSAVRDLEVPYEKELMALKSELTSGPRIFFKGLLSREAVVNEMQNCHVFLSGSSYETFGVVLAEALACGRPVITTPSGGPNDIVNPEDGIICADFSAATIAEAMQEMYSNYESFDSKVLSENCYKRFSSEVIIGRLEEIYKEIS